MSEKLTATRAPSLRLIVQTLSLYAALSLGFQGLSLYFGYKRYFFGAELLLPMLLFSLGWLRSAGWALLLAMALELALGISSMFYLFEKEQLWDMAEFLSEARPAYLLAFACLPVVPLAVALFGRRVFRGAKRNRSAVLAILLAAVGLLQTQWLVSSELQTFFTPTLVSARKDLIFGSTTHFLQELMVMNRLQTIGDRIDEHAEYFPVQHPSATQLTWGGGEPSSTRVLFVVAEGWGLPKDQSMLDAQIASLSRSSHVRMLEVNNVYAKGATAAGELRELCGVVPTRYNFRRMTQEAVGDCLPEQWRKKGYVTAGIHGAYGGMYRRVLWWPKIGLSKAFFKEDIRSTQVPCYSFPGHCDRELLPVVSENLMDEKVLVYWLTLNSHMPYDRRDVALYRETLCKDWYASESQSQLCDYQNLHVQFFEGLAALAADKNMAGVEVLVVGDHAPLFNDEEAKNRFIRDRVPMLHFFVQ